jgi:hypothetical protein
MWAVHRGGRRAIAFVVFVAALGLASATATAANDYPLLEVTGDAHLLGEVNDLNFDLEYLSSAGQSSSVSIKIPPGFSGSFAQAPGTKLGTAGLGLLPAGKNISTSSSSAISSYEGSLMVMDPSAYANDPADEACAPGPHRAVWNLAVANVAHGDLSVPIAVDASGGGYELTMCFASLQAAGNEVEFLYFEPDQVFRNPGKQGNYLFDGVVTPSSDADSASQPLAYELRAYQPLPQILTAAPTFDSSTKTLTVTGKLQANGRARGSVYVEIHGAMNPDAVTWANLGLATTLANGSYTLTRKFGAFKYSYVYASVDDQNAPTCPGRSAQPQGCASISTDGRDSAVSKITTLP